MADRRAFSTPVLCKQTSRHYKRSVDPYWGNITAIFLGGRKVTRAQWVSGPEFCDGCGLLPRTGFPARSAGPPCALPMFDLIALPSRLDAGSNSLPSRRFRVPGRSHSSSHHAGALPSPLLLISRQWILKNIEGQNTGFMFVTKFSALVWLGEHPGPFEMLMGVGLVSHPSRWLFNVQ